MSEDHTSSHSQSIIDKTVKWHSIDLEGVIDRLDVNPDQGLTKNEANRRIEVYGANKLREAPPTTIWEMLWEQFSDFVVMLLIVAAVISALLGDWIEAAAIMAIVLLNAALGVIQNRRAAKELAALKQLAAPEANVMRDGSRVNVPGMELVPGDIVFLEAGNYIPADVRLLETVNLRVDEVKNKFIKNA